MTTITFKDFLGQGNEIQTLRKQIENHIVVHALMITGEAGTGKRTLAGLLCEALMCKAQTGIPCGKCSGCRLAVSGEHPDITVIEKGVPLARETAKGRATIPVDDIREMIRICSQYPLEGGNRVVMIRDADNMTFQAQNSLLKILEEPPQNTFFILTSSHPDQLLITVKSRCRPLKMTPWETEYIQQVLLADGVSGDRAEKAAAAAFGSIGYAKKLASDDEYWHMRETVMNAFFRNRKRSEILSFSSSWKDRKNESDAIFDILEQNLQILLHCRIDKNGQYPLKEFPEEWLRFAEYAPLEKFAGLSDKIREARKQNAFNVNFQAIIEQLLLTFIGESELWVQ